MVLYNMYSILCVCVCVCCVCVCVCVCVRKRVRMISVREIKFVVLSTIHTYVRKYVLMVHM